MGATADLCLERHTDAERLNELVNHPSVRPTCGGDGCSTLDLTAFAVDPKNHAMAWDHGAFLFQWSAPQTYEVHMMVLPEGRGRDAYHMAARGIAYMAEQGAERLWARVAKNAVELRHAKNAAALRHYTASAGFAKCGTDTLDVGFGPVTYDLYQRKVG